MPRIILLHHAQYLTVGRWYCMRTRRRPTFHADSGKGDAYAYGFLRWAEAVRVEDVPPVQGGFRAGDDECEGRSLVVASSDIWAGRRGVIQFAIGLGLSVVDILVMFSFYYFPPLFNSCFMFYLLPRSSFHFLLESR